MKIKTRGIAIQILTEEKTGCVHTYAPSLGTYARPIKGNKHQLPFLLVLPEPA